MPISKINTTSITDNSVTAGKIVAGAVDADIAAGSIDTAQIADDAVTTVKITDANITTAKIADDAVTADKLANAINTSIAAKAPTASPVFTGNVGIGVTPESAWASAYTVLQTGGTGAQWSNDAQAAGSIFDQGQNIYREASAEKYIVTDEASKYRQYSGTHIFQVAPSGTADATISWTTAMTIDNAGIVTKPYQPAFSAYAAAAQNNLSTAYTTITFDTERFDQNADFNTTTHTFTAPVTGKYLFAACVGLKAIPLNCQWIFMRILTSNQGYNMSEETAKWDADTSNGFTTGFASSVLADMDAGDTAKVDIYQYTGTIATDVATGAGYTWFTGYLVA